MPGDVKTTVGFPTRTEDQENPYKVALYLSSNLPITHTVENGDTALDVHVSNSFPTSDTLTPTAIIVSTTAVQLLAANGNRKGFTIVNNGTDDLYIGDDNTVTASGVTMGAKVRPNGEMSDGEVNVYTGAIWGIYASAQASQNVSVLEKT